MPTPPVLRYLALGDSYTAGTGASEPAANFPSILARHLEAATGVSVLVVNPAVDGYTSDDLIREELPHLAKDRPHVISVLIGANDVVQGRDRATYAPNLERIYDVVASAVGARHGVLTVSVPNWARSPAASAFGEPEDLERRILEVNRIARAASEQRGFLHVDIFPLSGASRPGWISEDGLHPSDLQYQAWADLMFKAVADPWTRIASALAGAEPGPLDSVRR